MNDLNVWRLRIEYFLKLNKTGLNPVPEGLFFYLIFVFEVKCICPLPVCCIPDLINLRLILLRYLWI